MKNYWQTAILFIFLINHFIASGATCQTNYGVTISSQSDWNTASNWSCGSVPGASDDVTITVSANINFDVTVNSLTISNGASPGSLSVSSGTLTVTNGFTISGYMTSLAISSGGTLSVGGTVTLNGTAVTIDIDGNLDMVGLTVDGVTSNELNVGSTGVVTITSDVTIQGSAGFDVESGGQVNITGDVNVIGSGTLDVDGTMDIDGDLSVLNSADVEINGSLSVTGDATITSSVAMSGSGTISIGGSLIGSTGSVVLPVELTYFKGYSEENIIILEWETASEINNSHFLVEKSNDGTNFISLGEVTGYGNSSIKQNYSFQDDQAFSGTQFYRLKQVDFDGAFEYSNVISIEIKNYKTDFICAYPNPISESKITTISFYSKTGNCIICLYDLNGKVLFHKEFKGLKKTQLNEIRLDLSKIRNTNIAVLSINNGGSLLQKKLVF